MREATSDIIARYQTSSVAIARDSHAFAKLARACGGRAHEVGRWIAQPHDVRVRVQHVVPQVNQPRHLACAHRCEALPRGGAVRIAAVHNVPLRVRAV